MTIEELRGTIKALALANGFQNIKPALEYLDANPDMKVEKLYIIFNAHYSSVLLERHINDDFIHNNDAALILMTDSARAYELDPATEGLTEVKKEELIERISEGAIF
jgi:hypothetical protein